MIAFINSVVAGAGVALLVDGLVGGSEIGLVSGIGTVLALMTVFYLFQRWRFESFAAEPAGDRPATDGR